MPRKIFSLQGHYDSITRPVATGVIRDVARICELGSDIKVYLANEFDKVKQNHGVIGDEGDGIWSGNNRIRAVARETTRHSAIINQIVRQAEMPSIFEDPKLGVYVKPVYQYVDLAIEIKYSANSRQEAQRWRDNLVAKFAENLSTMTHEVHYDIPIPNNVMVLLTHLHELREKVAGYGQTLSQYLKSIQKRPLKLLSTADDDINKATIVLPEKQAQAQGWFSGNDIPVENKVENEVTWTIEFTYNLNYHRATHLYVAWPLMVHQQHVRRPWFDSRPRYTVDELPKRGALGIRALDVIQGNVDSFPAPADGMRVPSYDEWIPGYRNQRQYSVPGITWMIMLSPEDPQDIVNLAELPDLRFTQEIDLFFRKYHTDLTVFGNLPVYFNLYCEDRPMGDTALTVDGGLNVRSTTPLDLRKTYHLRLNFPTLYGCFRESAIRSMQTNWNPTLQIFQSIFPPLDVEYAKSILIDGQYLPKSYIKWFYKLLEDKSIGFQDNTGGPGGSISRGESGSLPGSSTGNGGGVGGSDNQPGSNPGGDWGYQDPWSREGDGHIKYLQLLSIVAKRT